MSCIYNLILSSIYCLICFLIAHRVCCKEDIVYGCKNTGKIVIKKEL